MINTNDLKAMHQTLFQMIEDLYDDDKDCEGNQALAHQIVQAVMTIEAELSLREAGVFA
jgi:hypothetical protein